MQRLLTILMLAAACGFTQSRPDRKTPRAAAAPAKWPLANVNLEGLHHYTREQVLTASGLKIGQLAGKADFEAARDRLLATGAFETVGYKFVAAPGEAKGYIATFQLVEIEQAYPVRFEELHVSELEAERALQAKDPLFSLGRLPATQPVLERHARLLQEFLAGKGINEKIVGAVDVAGPGEYTVVFRPSRPLPAVAHVRFHGNQVFNENILWDAVSASAVGLGYTEDRFREVLRSALRPMYEARGRVHVTFPEIRTEPARDVEGLTVTVTVDEGESYTLGKVAVVDQAPLSSEVLLKEGDFRTGDVANMELVNGGVDRMRQLLRRAGYIEANTAITRRLNNENKTVDIDVHMDAGPQYIMGKLTLVGLELEGEAQIKRMWGLKNGKPFNPEYPDHFLARVRQDGVFDRLGKTKAETKVDEKNRVVDVTLTFGATPAPPARPGRRESGGFAQ